MRDKFQIGQGLGHQLEMAFARNGWTIEQVSQLTKGDVLRNYLKVITGKSIITAFNIDSVEGRYVIDCDAPPFIWHPDYEIYEHIKGGQLEWHPNNVELFQDQGQMDRYGMSGSMIRKKLANRSMNANVLDFLLAHPEYIPHEWNGKYVYFWSTIYQTFIDSDRYIFVRYLYQEQDKWVWGYHDVVSSQIGPETWAAIYA